MKHVGNLTKEIIIETVTDLAKPIHYISYDNKLKLIKKTIDDCKESCFPTAEILTNKMIDILLQLIESEYNTCRVLLQMCLDDTGGGEYG